MCLLVNVFFSKNEQSIYYGIEFLVTFDHRPLIYLHGLEDLSSKLTRTRLELEEFSFKVILREKITSGQKMFQQHSKNTRNYFRYK